MAKRPGFVPSNYLDTDKVLDKFTRNNPADLDQNYILYTESVTRGTMSHFDTSKFLIGHIFGRVYRQICNGL